jgi:hypothetical protein
MGDVTSDCEGGTVWGVFEVCRRSGVSCRRSVSLHAARPQLGKPSFTKHLKIRVAPVELPERIAWRKGFCMKIW